MKSVPVFFKTFLMVLMAVTLIQAQEDTDIRCGNDFKYKDLKYLKSLRKATIQYDDTVKGVVKIPIVFHIIHNRKDGSIGTTNVSDELIKSQIQILNEDYRRKAGTRGFNDNPKGADIEIEFQLATTDPHCNPTSGIVRYYDATQDTFYLGDPAISKGRYWPHDQYLNIWVCNLGGGILGYAQYPNHSGLIGLGDINGADSTDGLVVRYRAFGLKSFPSSKDYYAYGRTATHEIGHCCCIPLILMYPVQTLKILSLVAVMIIVMIHPEQDNQILRVAL